MVTPASRGGEPHRVTAKPTPQDQQTRAEFEAIFRTSADKSPRPDIHKPLPLNRKGSVLKPQPEGSLLSRVMNFILKLLGLKSTAQKTQIVKDKLTAEVSAPELTLEQALEKARQGGPAKEAFEAVRKSPDKTKEMAQSRYQTLKQQVEHQMDHTGIQKLGEKLDLPRDAAFGLKVKEAADQIAKNRGAAVKKRDNSWKQQELLKGKLHSLSTELERSQATSVKLAQANATLTDKTNPLLGELEGLATKLEKLVESSVVWNKEKKLDNLNKEIKAKTTELDGVRVKIIENEQTMKAAHEERIGMKTRLSKLPDEIDRALDEITKLFQEIDGLDQSMRELNTVKLKAGEENEALLEQLLNSFVLQRAVDAYAENPQQQAPENFLSTYKLLHQEELKNDFTKELDGISISPPDIIWDQLIS